MTRRPIEPGDMAERSQFQPAVVSLAYSLGWGVKPSDRRAMLAEASQYGVEPPPLDGLVFHPRWSMGSESGWPDLTLIRRRDRRLVFAELKTEKGKLSPRQAEVLDLLRCLEGTHFTPRSRQMGVSTGTSNVLWGDETHVMTEVRIDVHVWRPSDLASGRIAEVLR
jgi:hypothetical protein